MAKPGARPKPTGLKILEGNPGKRPLNDREPQPCPGHPECPEDMPSLVRKVWDRSVSRLSEVGVLTVIDGAMLERYCYASVEWHRASLAIRKHGQTMEGKDGNPKARPEIGIVDKYAAIMHRIEVEFGMSPSSRTRIRTEPGAVVDEFQAFLDADRA